MSNFKLSASFGEVNLSVAPKEMYKTALLIEDKINTSKQLFESMLKQIKRTSHYWEGDVADSERQRFENQNENFQNLIINLNNYATELKTITSIYTASERENADYAQSLQQEILS